MLTGNRMSSVPRVLQWLSGHMATGLGLGKEERELTFVELTYELTYVPATMLDNL